MTGEDLRRLRRTLDMSQAAFAHLLGLRSGNSVYKKEKGQRAITSRDIEILLAKRLISRQQASGY